MCYATSKCTLSSLSFLLHLYLSVSWWLSVSFYVIRSSCHTKKWWIELFSPQHTFYLQMDKCHQLCHRCITCNTLCAAAQFTLTLLHIDVRIFAIKRLDSILFSFEEWASFFMTFVIVECSSSNTSSKIIIP